MSHHGRQYLPEVVRKALHDLRRASGSEPHVSALGTSWRVWVRTERVYVSVTWRLTGVCRWANTKRILRIDGAPRFLTTDNDKLGRLFRDPDGKIEPDTLPPLPTMETVDWDEVPAIVQKLYESIERKQNGEAQVVLAQVGERWVVGVEMEDASLRLNLSANRRGKWRLDPKDPLNLLIDGHDYTEEFDGDVTAAIALLMGKKSAPAMPQVLGTPTPAARSNAVETRRGTVFRI